jgi:hypothetical protein
VWGSFVRAVLTDSKWLPLAGAVCFLGAKVSHKKWKIWKCINSLHSQWLVSLVSGCSSRKKILFIIGSDILWPKLWLCKYRGMLQVPHPGFTKNEGCLRPPSFANATSIRHRPKKLASAEPTVGPSFKCGNSSLRFTVLSASAKLDTIEWKKKCVEFSTPSSGQTTSDKSKGMVHLDTTLWQAV